MSEQTEQLRVFLADDHGVLRSGLRMLVNAQPEMTVVGEAADGQEAVERVLAQGGAGGLRVTRGLSHG